MNEYEDSGGFDTDVEHPYGIRTEELKNTGQDPISDTKKTSDRSRVQKLTCIDFNQLLAAIRLSVNRSPCASARRSGNCVG